MKQLQARESIVKWAEYFGLVPKTMRVKNFHNGGAWVKNQCSVQFYTNDNNETYFSFDGNAKQAYQLGLNILNDKEAQQEIGVTL